MQAAGLSLRTGCAPRRALPCRPRTTCAQAGADSFDNSHRSKKRRPNDPKTISEMPPIPLKQQPAQVVALKQTVKSLKTESVKATTKLLRMLFSGVQYIFSTWYCFEFVSIPTILKYIVCGPIVLAALLSTVGFANNVALVLQTFLLSA